MILKRNGQGERTIATSVIERTAARVWPGD